MSTTKRETRPKTSTRQVQRLPTELDRPHQPGRLVLSHLTRNTPHSYTFQTRHAFIHYTLDLLRCLLVVFAFDFHLHTPRW